MLDISVTVNTNWAGPHGVTFSSIVPVNLENNTRAIVVSSFGREQSGNYTCTAKLTTNSLNKFVIESNTTTGEAQVTVGNLIATTFF